MQIYVHRNGQKMGPYSTDDVRSSLAAGSIQFTDLAWHEGATGWMPLSAIPGIIESGIPAIPRQIIPAVPIAPTSGLAIASLVLGIAGFLTTGITAIPAVVCGHLSLSQIKKAPGSISGSGLALAGLITGYIGIAFMLIMIVMLIFMASIMAFSLTGFRDAMTGGEKRVECLDHAKQIANACKKYAKDHEGRYPDALTDLVPKYVHNRAVLMCPLVRDDDSVGYKYFAGKDTDPGSKVLLISNGQWNKKKVTITRDGEEKPPEEE